MGSEGREADDGSTTNIDRLVGDGIAAGEGGKRRKGREGR